MNKEQLEHFETILRQWLADLQRHANDTVAGMKEIEFITDFIDRASFESERSFQLRIRDRESVLIRKIKNSLDDIKNGTYGICEECEKEISIKRLEARPVARHCIACKRALELKEKMTGT
jgi:DnaK suppressor protein